METEKNADLKKEERSQIVDLGSDMTRSEKAIFTRLPSSARSKATR